MSGLTTILLAGTTLASSGDSDSTGYLLLLGPALAVGFYTSVYLRYRNTDKRFEFEHKTSAQVSNVRAADQLVDRVHGTERKTVPGANSASPNQRLGAGTRIFIKD